MDIYFCDICNESVPASDLDRGMAFRRGERVVCAACDKAMSNEGDDAVGAPAVGGAALGGAALGGAAEESAASVWQAEPTSETAGPAAEPAASAPARGRSRLTGCLIALLFLFFMCSLAINALLWVEGRRTRDAFNASVELLERGDARVNIRIGELQTNIARQTQEKDAYVRETFKAMEGAVGEKFANLGNRVGRSENAVEALRQSSTEDRRALEASVKGVASTAAVASEATESTKEEVEYLTDRVVALEEVLDGGMTSGGIGNAGRQPSWVSHLPELKDASAGNRWNAVTVLGETEDPRVVSYLLPMLDDEDVFVRMATARVLGDLDSFEAVPGLIDALSDSQAAVREAAVVALRILSGKDFRFDPLGKEGDRNKAQSSWRKWWADNSEDASGG